MPADAHSLQFKAAAFSSFSVSLAGHNLVLIPIGTGANYTLFGADISAYAGQTGALTITALAAPNNGNYFDSFVFSTSAVPEPSVVGLLTLGGLFLGWRWRKSSR